MPKQTAAQQKKVKKVMHEYKEGDLKSSSGQKVKSRKQAIAIGLSEAGASYKDKKGKAAGKKATKTTASKRAKTSKRTKS